MTKKCLQCNKEFEKPYNESLINWNTRHKYCSKECYTKSMKGKDILGVNRNNVAWNKGVAILNNRRKESDRHIEMGRIEYKLWRKACFERDNFTCQKSGQNGGNLEVHHIFNYKDFPELKLSIDNGITLSKKEHKNFHKIYGNRNNTKEQLINFLAQEA